MLVIGDCCTDDSEQVVASFKDDRVHWTNLAVNAGGQWAPNNHGIKLARGEYIAYLGHDDLWHPTHLETLVDTLDRTGADLAYAAGILFGEPGSDGHAITGLVHPSQDDNAAPSVPPSTLAHRADLIERIGYWKDASKIPESVDDEFLQRAWHASRSFAGTDDITVFKFPASWRSGIYLQREAKEQESLLKVMNDEGFRYEQLLEVARAFSKGTGRMINLRRDSEPGELFELNRRFKGADGPRSAMHHLEEVDLSVERAVNCKNLHGAEINHNGSFRWTGPELITEVPLMALPGPERELRIHVVASFAPLDQVRLEIDGFSLEVFVHQRQDGTADLVSIVPDNIVRDGLLTITTTEVKRPADINSESRDTRPLGIAVSSVRLSLPERETQKSRGETSKDAQGSRRSDS